jgi:hypothetical protein
MDIRNIFKEISEQLQSEFRKSVEAMHPGGKGDLREEAFRDFLTRYLPARYGVGRGEVITPENRVSGQLDIVIYDSMHCPVLVTSGSHSVYPIESVYGAISMKSHLDSSELKDGYENIASLKKILPRSNFTHYPTPGFAIGLESPVPVTGIVAYASNRTLEAIAAQAQKLDHDSADIKLRPDFIAVLGKGIIGPREPLRGEFNAYQLPDDPNNLVQLRKTGRHTLLRFYMEMVRELNTVMLRRLDLHAYDNMPRLVGPYRVGRHERFAMKTESSDSWQAVRLTKLGIDEIVGNAKAVTVGQHLLNRFGQMGEGAEGAGLDPELTIYEYNPKGLPPISLPT